MKKIIDKVKLGVVQGISILLILVFGNYILQARNGTDNLSGNTNDTVTSTKRNQLLTKLNTAIGRSGPDSLTASSGDKLTATKWNGLVTKINTYANNPTCTNDNTGNCNINVATKSALEPNLLAGNIKSGVSIFGVTGTLMGGFPLRENICQNSNGTYGKVTLNWRIGITCGGDSGRLSAQANPGVSYYWQSSTNTCGGYQRIGYTWQCSGSSPTPVLYPACVNGDGTYGQVSINPWNIGTTGGGFGGRSIGIIAPNGSTYYTTPGGGATIWNYVYWSCN